MKGSFDKLLGLKADIIIWLIVAGVIIGVVLATFVPQILQGLGPGFFGTTDPITTIGG